MAKSNHADDGRGGAPHWSYAGEDGPNHWGDLSADFAACCSGQSQSPIDLSNATARKQSAISFNYRPSEVNILNNGHTIQVNYDPDSYMEVDGHRYDLVQFHFHSLSEHTIDGNYAPLEAHLVHADADGNLAVVGIMLVDGAANTALQPVFDNLPAEESPEHALDAKVNAADFLPADQSTWRYSGSLTTPPCSEGVAWYVMVNPTEISSAQIDAFQAIFSDNYRPIQPLNDRALTVDAK